jgi:cell wall-associated NlpC family hydrolase
MREVKEKSPLKERAAETLKSTPQAAFRRGTDASFQQLRQELREAAQDGQPEDRYESGKITDTADHAVRQAEHMAERAVHKLPKTKSEPQPDYPPQSQSQVNTPVRESASPIREKPVSPVNVQQPKTREYTPDAKASVSPSQHSTPLIHENVKAVPAETMPSTTEHSVRKSVSPIKEKPVPPANAPQPKMREHAPDAKAPVSSSQHATLRIHEKTQNVSAEITPTPTGSAEKHTAAPFEQSAHHLQMERSAHEQAFPIKEKPVPPANTPQPKMREHTPTADAPVHLPQHPASQIYERPQNVYQLQTNRSVRELETSVREKPSASSLREIPAALKPDTTQFALPEIKTKEYIRSRRQKQNFLKEEAAGIENITADSETFSPVIRTRETVREQQKLHVSHSAEQEQPALPQIRTRQPQSVSLPANTEPVTPDAPQPSLPDIKSKQKYIAAQQSTQVTPVQANPQQAAREMIQGDIKLCKPLFANETAPLPTGKNAAPAKPVRVQKQVRPAVVRKQKIKTAPKAKIKSATPAAKALPQKASSAAPKQAATVIRKGQVLRDTAIKTAKVAKEAGKKVLRAIAAAAEKLVAAIGAGGAAAVSVVVVILLVGMLFASPLGILFAGEDTGTEIKIPDAVATLNGEFTDEIYRIMEEHPYDELDMQEGMESAMLQNWRNVLAVYAVKVSTDEEHGLDVITMDEEKLQLLREIFFDANKLEYELTTRTVDGEQITTLHISAQIKDAMQMADEYSFTAQQREMLEELLKPDYDDIFLSLIGNYQPGGTPIGPVDISDIQGTLPDDLDPLRESIVLTAYQLLGKVTYFWGGKSLVLGWDSRWGTPTTVTASGSGSTGKVLPFGLDCSGFVDWTFYNATSGAYLPGRGGGAASQHGYCTNIAWSDALPGDLVFYADDSHVGIVCGYDSVGNLLVIHCSGGQNGVVVTGREGFAVAARPDLFAD